MNPVATHLSEPPSLRPAPTAKLHFPMTNPDLPGYLITFEGPEGSGKSTQVQRLAQTLEENGVPHVVTHEPGGTPLAQRVRETLLSLDTRGLSPRTELMFLLAARADHVSRLILPGLEAGQVVLCDRFIDSSVAYQGFGRGLPPTQVERLNDFATGGLLPNLTFLLDLPVAEGLRRAIGKEGPDRIESEALTFHERVRQGYLELSRDSGRWCVLDGRETPEALAQVIRAKVFEALRSVSLSCASSSFT